MARLSASLLVAFALFSFGAAAQEDPPAIPPEWQCPGVFFGAGDGCDCGCGAVDADCASPNIEACRFNLCLSAENQNPVADNNGVCVDGTCGDGIQGNVEQCDDGDGEACDATCENAADGFACRVLECHEITCGDGLRDAPELCDDANTDVDDGCDDECSVEAGFVCFDEGAGSCRPTVCGDRVVEGDEACDDGNDDAGDGCPADCLAVEDGFACPLGGGPCTAVPDAWTCEDETFGSSDGCDCGCGVLDPDCDGGGCAEPGCAADQCLFCFDADGAQVDCAQGGEGEGEGEGDEGEGEGEGEVEGEGEDEGEADDGDGCAAAPAATTSTFPLLAALALVLRRRR